MVGETDDDSLPQPDTTGNLLFDSNIIIQEKWTSLVASCHILFTCGSVYFFSSFSDRLAESMGYDNVELNNIGTAFDLGQWFGIIAGIACDHVGVYKCGTVGCWMSTIGFLLLGSVVQGFIPISSSIFTGFCCFVIAQGNSWAYVAAMKFALGTFAIEERGSVIGLISCSFALSSGFFSQTYKLLFSPSSGVETPLSTFFFVMAGVIFIVQMLSLHQMNAILVSRRNREQLSVASPLYTMSPRASPSGHQHGRVKAFYGYMSSLALIILFLSLGGSLWHLHISILRVVWTLLLCLVIALVKFPAMYEYLDGKVRPGGIRTTISDEISSNASVVPGRVVPITEDGAVIHNAEELTTRGLQREQETQDDTVPSLDHDESKRESLRSVAYNDDNDDSSKIVASSQVSARDVNEDWTTQPDSNQEDEEDEENDAHRLSLAQTCQAMKAHTSTSEFWLFTSAVAFGLGFPILVINNTGTLVAALRTDVHEGQRVEKASTGLPGMQDRIALMVALFAVFNMGGRMTLGVVMEVFGKGRTRAIWLALPISTLLLFNIALLLVWNPILELVICVCGFGVGGIFSVSPLACADYFGLKTIGTVWGVLLIGAAVSMEFFSTLIAGRTLDSRAEHSSFFVEGRRYCLGKECYIPSLVVTLVAEVVALCCALTLSYRGWGVPRSRNLIKSARD